MRPSRNHLPRNDTQQINTKRPLIRYNLKETQLFARICLGSKSSFCKTIKLRNLNILFLTHIRHKVKYIKNNQVGQ